MTVSEDRDELLGAQDRVNQSMIDLANKTREAQRKAQPTAAELMRTNVAAHAGITIKNGIMQTAIGGDAKSAASSPDDPNMVTLANGMRTTTAAARAAGFTIAEKQQDRQPNFPSGPADAPSAGPDNTEGQNNASTTGETKEETAQIDDALATLAQANETLGQFTVSAMQEDVVSSGELPRNLPEGVTQEQINTVAQGFVAQANAVLRPTGATVEALSQMLNENELREARLATFRGDNAKLQQLGGEAMGRLERLPNDPAHFAELTRDWPSDIQLTRKNNTVYVKLPEWDRERAWGEVVRSGVIRF